jgi:hypothetical protein
VNVARACQSVSLSYIMLCEGRSQPLQGAVLGLRCWQVHVTFKGAKTAALTGALHPQKLFRCAFAVAAVLYVLHLKARPAQCRYSRCHNIATRLPWHLDGFFPLHFSPSLRHVTQEPMNSACCRHAKRRAVQSALVKVHPPPCLLASTWSFS